MDQVFQPLIDHTRASFEGGEDQDHPGIPQASALSQAQEEFHRVEVVVEKPTYDLTVFKVHCGKLTLKIYTKGTACFASKPWCTTRSN